MEGVVTTMGGIPESRISAERTASVGFKGGRSRLAEGMLTAGRADTVPNTGGTLLLKLIPGKSLETYVMGRFKSGVSCGRGDREPECHGQARALTDLKLTIAGLLGRPANKVDANSRSVAIDSDIKERIRKDLDLGVFAVRIG